MRSFEQFYEESLRIPPSDLPWNPMGFNRSGPDTSGESALMPIFTYFASLCDHVTELGCREGYSTVALAKGVRPGGKLVSVDRCKYPIHDEMLAMQFPCNWELIYEDTVGGFVIEDTDLLHVDTLHEESHVEKELAAHGHKVRRFLSFHDVVSQGILSDDIKGAPGICGAIERYTRTGWKKILSLPYSHGLDIYERVS